VTFDPLDREELARIAGIQIEQLQKRLDDRRIQLDLDQDARAWLVDHGFDPVYGARPLRRLVQTAVGDKLAMAILDGTVRDGDTVQIGVAENGDSLTLRA